jgi:tRNA(Ile)-lysidine synthase
METKQWHDIANWLESFRGQVVYVACSGGVDSMSLLHFLLQNNHSVHVLHVNYHKRGEESNKDEQLVKEYCQTNQVPCTIRHFEPSNVKGNFQEIARKFRYDFFEEMVHQQEGVVALAHHFDDQIETFFMHLARKSGIAGLSAMSRIRSYFIRPFLPLKKEEIYAYATFHKIPWREDASNQESTYVRNKWRLDLLPTLRNQFPNLDASVATLIDAFQGEQERLTKEVEPIVSVIKTNGKLAVKVAQNLSDEALFELWRQLNQPAILFPRFQALLSLPKGKKIEAKNEFSMISTDGNELHFHLKDILLSKVHLHTMLIHELPSTFSKDSIYLNSAKIKGDLIARYWQENDKIAPVGMKGVQLVSKVLKDAKIPVHQRKQQIVVADEEDIHWVVGYKIGRKALAQKGDQPVLKVNVSVG